MRLYSITYPYVVSSSSITFHLMNQFSETTSVMRQAFVSHKILLGTSQRFLHEPERLPTILVSGPILR